MKIKLLLCLVLSLLLSSQVSFALEQTLRVGDYVYTPRTCSMIPTRGDSAWCAIDKSTKEQNYRAIERILSISKNGKVELAGPAGQNYPSYDLSQLQPVTIEQTPFKRPSKFKIGSKVFYIVKNQYPPVEEATIVNFDSETQTALLIFEYSDRAFDGSRTYLTRGSFGTLDYSDIYVVKPVSTLRYNNNFYFDKKDVLSNVTLHQVISGRCDSIQSCERIRKAQGLCDSIESCEKREPVKRMAPAPSRGRMG